jgi:hypothetical protein
MGTARILEKYFMNQNWKLHECEKLPAEGVEVVYFMDSKFRKSMTWQLVIRREATEADLEENNAFEEIGDTIWETMVEISHCPFCGTPLFKKNDQNSEDFGKHIHYDYSQWDKKVQ